MKLLPTKYLLIKALVLQKKSIKFSLMTLEVVQCAGNSEILYIILKEPTLSYSD